ncbi:MAG: acyltransferase [Rubritalea sp.]|uniref:acyltransferase family protein n=1 Tax=Rubritalea sp. TaxID=2109375 RepID=UPI003242D562
MISRFSRVTSSGNYMPEIDGLRFVAIMAVLLYHAHILYFANPIPQGVSFPVNWDWLNFAIGQGWFGVQVFFVISGFVLALPFAGHSLKGRNPVNLKTYYSRRMVRIGFPYLIALTLGLLFQIIQGVSFLECLAHYATGIIYSNSLFYNGELNPLLFVSWTLEIEIQFYLLAPLLCKIFTLRSSTLRYLILLSSIYIVYSCVNHLGHQFPSGIWSRSILGQLQFFLAGLLLGDIYLKFWKERSNSTCSALVFDAIGIAAWLFIPFALKINGSHSWLAYLLLIAFTCILRGRLLKSLLSLPLIATIGGMCYSIYLFHGHILYFLHINFITPIFGLQKGNWPFNLVPLTLLITLTLFACSVAYYYIERPSMRWGSKKS